MSQLGCQQTFSLLINLKLNSCLLVFLNSFPKFLILLFVGPLMSLERPQTPHVILALFLTHHSLSQNITYPCLNHAFYPFVTFVESGTLSTIPLLKPSQRLSFIPRSTTVTLSFSIFLDVNLIAFNLFSTLQLKLFLKPLAFAISHPSILRSLHWLKIDQRIQVKRSFSLTYKTLQSQKPSYLYSLLNLQPNTSTRSSTVITLQRPPVNSRLKITDRSFTYHAPALWNSLPKDTEIHLPIYHTQQMINNLSPSQFHSKLKTHLFLQSFPP